MENKFEETKYGALRIVATINKILGWLIIIGGALTAFYRFNYAYDETMALAIFAISLLVGLLSIAAGEIFYVFMDIEQNTRYIDLIVQKSKSDDFIKTENIPKIQESKISKPERKNISNLTDALTLLESEGFSIIRTPKNPFLADGKDFIVIKNGNRQEYYASEIIDFAKTISIT